MSKFFVAAVIASAMFSEAHANHGLFGIRPLVGPPVFVALPPAPPPFVINAQALLQRAIGARLEGNQKKVDKAVKKLAKIMGATCGGGGEGGDGEGKDGKGKE